MWASALKTYDDPETNYLFYPEEVIKHPREKIQTDLLKHKLALQRNKHTDIWMIIAKALHDHFGSDPRELFAAGNWDVVDIQHIIQQEKRKDFPYLSGPKMANYWLYIVTHYTDASFKNMEEISIIPDTHVLQSTARLGLVEGIATPLIAAQAWKELLSGSSLTSVEMHPVLWNWSRNNFSPSV